VSLIDGLAATNDALRRELADAKAEVERLRSEVSDLLAERDGYSAAYTMSVRELALEADELRRLAWEWCFGAVALRELLELVDDGLADIIATRNAAVARIKELEAEQAGPLPTAVLADSPDEPPIESLGPVPLTADRAADMSDGYSVGVPREMRTIAWLVRDAVRRGAKLEGGA
jgi:hypothetical protein